MFDPDALDRRDPALVAALLPAFRAFSRTYLRLRCEGTEHIPAGPCLLVANHSGGIMGPDLFCTMSVLWEHFGPDGALYALAHDFAMRHFTPLGRVLTRLGCVRACAENASRVFARGGSVLVYPGGDLDAYRHFRRRHEVVFGERTGFVRLAQRCGVPIVPVVASGAHRSALILTEGERLAAMLGLPRWARTQRFPIALALPWGLALGPYVPYLPLPFPIRLRILPPIDADPGRSPLSVRDDVQSRMQRVLDELTRRP